MRAMPRAWRVSVAAAMIGAAGTLLTAQAPPAAAGALRALPVQGQISMLVGGVSNIAVQIGRDGVLLVDTMVADAAPQVGAVLRSLTDKPIRVIVNTSYTADHVGGNDALQSMGATGLTAVLGGGATVVAHENVLNRLTAPVRNQRTPPPQKGLPTSEYSTPQKDFYFNGEPVVVMHEPRAHSDSDSIVFFRRSDVIAVGDLFVPDRYPAIDAAAGGSVDGLIDALNHILLLTVPERLQDGGTRIVPGHGRMANEADVVEYRDMVVIVRDRVRAALAAGQTPAQIKAAGLTLDYDNVYGRPDDFLEAVIATAGGLR
jgi:glyoxylase-like metal-dependent hydrolase (beta-lactamase superfamily II)